MSDKFKRRRRRTGSTSARFKPSQLIPVESVSTSRVGRAELAACGAVAIVAIALIALIWIVTDRAVTDDRVEIRDRAEHALIGQAATMAETVAHELLVIDQSLIVIQSAWKADSASVDLVKWQKEMPALLSVADDLFIADEKHVIQQDIVPKAVGQGIGAAYVTFPHGSLEQYESDGTQDRDSLVMMQGDLGQPIDARQFLMYIIRPLDHPKGWMVGASYRSQELTKLFAQAALGYAPLVSLIDTKRGFVQAVVGPGARRPKTDISKSALFAAMSRSQSGSWTGETPIDDVVRLNAFHKVPDRDMAVVVAANLVDIMAPAESLASGARALASVGSALVLLIGGVVLWEVYTIRGNRRQKRIYERTRGELTRLRTDEAGLSAKAQLNAARLQIVLDHTADGIALFDSVLRIVQWNHPFFRGIGVEPKQDMPLDTLLRAQAAAGLFAGITDTEAEIARRVVILRSGDARGVPQTGPDGEALTLLGLPTADGGFMLLLSGLTSWEPAPPPPPSNEIDEPPVPEVATTSATIEW